jgi:hypothetical protein
MSSMIRMLAAAPGALIVAGLLAMLAALIAEETVRRRLNSRKTARLNAAMLAEDAAMASRAYARHTSFVAAAEAHVERKTSPAAGCAWPSAADLAKAAAK